MEIGVGPTEALSLRVSAAALVRVTFRHPLTGQRMLALELKAGLIPSEAGRRLYRIALPFGGVSRLNQPQALLERIPDFHYDSPRAQAEQDLRILIRPRDWPAVKAFCLEHYRRGDGAILESDPLRELVEEFGDARLALTPSQVRLRPCELLVEDQPVATRNYHAAGMLTVRVYALFEAELLDPALVEQVLLQSRDLSEPALERRALQDLERGGRGRANTAAPFELERLADLYRELPAAQRGEPLLVDGLPLGGNVAAVLEGLEQPQYERQSFSLS